MPGPLHQNQTAADGIHTTVAYQPADAAALAALSVVADDIGKVAQQQDTGDFYILRSVGPSVWEMFGAGASPVSSVFGRTGAVVSASGDYTASQVDNDSGVAGASVAAALDQLATDIAAIPAAPVDSVNGQVGVVVLGAADVGADPAGSASAAVAAHEAAPDPHPQYTTAAEAAAAAPVQSVNGLTGTVTLAASDVGNDSGVAGASVAVALDQLDADIAAIPAAPVDSVNGQTGVVVLESDDIANQSGVAGASVTNALDTLQALGASLVPQTRVLTAGLGLSGGGDLSADRTFDLDFTEFDITDLETAELNPQRKLVPDGAGGVEWVADEPSAFSGVDSAGATVINSGAYVDIPLFTVPVLSGDWSHVPGSAVVTYTGPTALVQITAGLTCKTTATNIRSQVDSRVQIDPGGGFVDLDGSEGTVYCRQVFFGGTSFILAIRQMNTGDQLKLQGARANGLATITTVANGSTLSAVVLQGPRGPAGPTGSGSNVTVQSAGAPLGNTPNDTLNFTGGLVASPGAGAVAEVDTRERGRAFSGYKSTATTIAAVGVTLLNPDTEKSPHDTDAYTWAAGLGATIDQAGRYNITAHASFDVDVDVTTTRVALQIFVNGVAVPGTLSISDHEPGGFTPGQPSSSEATLDLSPGDLVQIGASILSGGSTMEAVADTQMLDIKQLIRS